VLTGELTARHNEVTTRWPLESSGTLIQQADRRSIGIAAKFDEVNSQKSLTMLSMPANLALTETCLIAAMRKSHPRAVSAGEESTVTAATNG
jgi:hypothetical protein